MNGFERGKALFQFLEGGKLDLYYIFVEDALLYALFLHIVVKGFGGPAQHAYDFVAEEEGPILVEEIVTKATFWSLMKSPSTTLVIL